MASPQSFLSLSARTSMENAPTGFFCAWHPEMDIRILVPPALFALLDDKPPASTNSQLSLPFRRV